MLKITYGNIFESKANVIAHGCNCRGGYNGGVAGQIRTRYPKAYQAYSDKFQIEGWQLGEIQLVKCKDYIIANMATQKNFGGSTVHADYPAIEKCYSQLFEICAKEKYSVASVRVGCGLANGNWSIVEKIIEQCHAKHSSVMLSIWELPEKRSANSV